MRWTTPIARAGGFAGLLLVSTSLGCVVGEIDEDAPPVETGEPGAGGSGAGPDAGPAGPADDPEGPTARTVLEDFAACMTLADWEAQGLGGIALIESSEGPCFTCHAAGQNGNYLNQDSIVTFTNIRNYPYVLHYARTDEQLNPIASDDYLRKSQDPGPLHPTFVLPPELAAGIETFFELTNARYQVGDCEDL